MTMTVKEQIEELSKMPQDSEVVMFRNSSLGVSHSPVHAAFDGHYAAEETWGGIWVDQDEIEEMREEYDHLDFNPTVCLDPLH